LIKREKCFYLLLLAAIAGLVLGLTVDLSGLFPEAAGKSAVGGYLLAVHPFLKIQLLVLLSGCTIYALPCSAAVLLYGGAALGSLVRQAVGLAGGTADWRLWILSLGTVSMLYLLTAGGMLACRKSRDDAAIGRIPLRYLFHFLALTGGIALVFLGLWLMNGWILGKSFHY